jgi:hypothetical protein
LLRTTIDLVLGNCDPDHYYLSDVLIQNHLPEVTAWNRYYSSHYHYAYVKAANDVAREKNVEFENGLGEVKDEPMIKIQVEAFLTIPNFLPGVMVVNFCYNWTSD